MIKDAKGMPRQLPFRSDVRFKLELNDLIALNEGLPAPGATRTDRLGPAVLHRLISGARLAVPGHVMNAFECRLLFDDRDIRIPSRVTQWLYENGYIDAEGSITTEGRAKIFPTQI